MRRWKLQAGIIALCTLAMVTATASAGTAAPKQAKPKVGGSMTVEVANSPTILDPVRIAMGNTGGAPDLASFALFGPLVIQDIASKSVKPILAESLKSSDNGKTWVLKLRPNLKFSDGTPYDANQVKANWDRAADPATGSIWISLLKTMSYTVDDPTTLTITLQAPNTLFDWAMTGSGGLDLIATPASLAALKAGTSQIPVGAGPFVLTDFVRSNHFTFKRNPNWYDKPRPYLDTLNLLDVQLEDTRYNALEAGQADMEWTNRQRDVDAAKANPALTVTNFQQVGWQGVAFNFSPNSPTSDPDVRKALVLSANIIQAGAGAWPGSPTADGFYNKWTPYYSGPFPGTNLAEAQKALDAYLKKTNQTSVTVEFVYPANVTYTNLSQILQAQWQRLKGMNVKITPLVTGSQTGITAQPMIGALVFPGCCIPDPSGYNNWVTGGSSNTRAYSNPTVDDAFNKARASNDPKVQNAQWKKAGQAITKDYALLPVVQYDPAAWIYYKDKVGGFTGWSNATARPDLLFRAGS